MSDMLQMDSLEFVKNYKQCYFIYSTKTVVQLLNPEEDFQKLLAMIENNSRHLLSALEIVFD